VAASCWRSKGFSSIRIDMPVQLPLFEIAKNYGMMLRFAPHIMRAVKSEPSTLPILSVASLLALRIVRGAHEVV